MSGNAVFFGFSGGWTDKSKWPWPPLLWTKGQGEFGGFTFFKLESVLLPARWKAMQDGPGV